MSCSRSLLLFLCLLLPAGCGGGRSAQDASLQRSAEDEKPRILFLNVEVFRDKVSGGEGVRLRDAMLAEGTLKSDYGDQGEIDSELHSGLLVCSFLDDNGNLLRRAVVENPLKKRFEYPGEDGRPAQKIVESDTGVFSLRTGWNPDFYVLQVEKILADTGVVEKEHENRKEIGRLTIEF